MAKPVFTLPLSDVQWFYKQNDDSDEDWHKTASFPSEIHVELLKAGKISDPYYGYNEQQIQWIGDAEWLYKCTFRVPAESTKGVLEFDGLDTVCDVKLNGKTILQSDNMFQSHVVSVELDGEENELLLHFKSARKLGQEIEAIHGRVRAGSTNLGDPSRVYVRKAQYAWRWDWVRL
jgi:beta-mannosidase